MPTIDKIIPDGEQPLACTPITTTDVELFRLDFCRYLARQRHRDNIKVRMITKDAPHED